MEQRHRLQQAKRIVVKLGTALLVDADGGLNARFIQKLAREVAQLRAQGRELILVSSGAIGAGLQAAGLKQRPQSIPAKQALAAIGQPRLMQAYQRAFSAQGLVTAQVLLTSDDIHHRQRYAHARNALNEILRLGAVPIFNENDTVAIEEIKFGDNDTLSAHITHLAEADLLVILTDVGGLYSTDPCKDLHAELVSCVERIDRRVESMAGDPSGCQGTGGMSTKVRAAKLVTALGRPVVIAGGRQPRVLARVLAGEELGTLFLGQGDPTLSGRKHWIFALKLRGSLKLDAGASAALRERGKSLLPSGVVGVEGNFQQGDCVAVLDPEGNELGRGLVNYSADEVRKLEGAKSSQIEARLGYKLRDEVIHRDDLMILK